MIASNHGFDAELRDEGYLWVDASETDDALPNLQRIRLALLASIIRW